jgi:hypothetical protein
MNLNIKSIAIILPFLLLGIIFGRYWSVSGMFNHHMQEHGHEGETGERDTFIGMKDDMIGEMIADGNYKCCLEKPCTYCIEKTPGHGEGATCLCLEDIMNGVHPCGECIGEILEGHGNRFISKYFASAIAEEVGQEYLGTLKSIIEDKYGVPIDNQI